MKKTVSMWMAAILAALLLAGCTGGQSSSQTESQSSSQSASQSQSATSSSQETGGEPGRVPVSVNIGAMKGPTGMGLVKLMVDARDDALDGDTYTFTLAGAATELVPQIAQGQLDIAAVPANLSSVLYHNTKGQVQVLAINTVGVLYILENGDTVNSLEDLAGRTLYASGKGATPEYGLNYILEQAGLAGQVTLEWKSEHAECVAAILNDPNGIAMLPQPFVTTAQIQNEGLRVALDLNEEWNKVQDPDAPSAMVTGVIIARRAFVEENPEAVRDFMERYATGVDYVSNNLEAAAALMGEFDIVPEAVAQRALPHCGITFVKGAEMKSLLGGYLEVLQSQNPEAIGGTLPEEDFYYEATTKG